MNASIEETIIAMERAALDRSSRGDPSGFLEISAEDVVYFEPMQPRRVDGLAALTALYETYRGQAQSDGYKLINPKVQVCGDAAVLTFNYESWTGNVVSRWNCTEVYRKDAVGWRIIQTHWSINNA